MPVASVNGIDVYFELHGEGPPLLNISGSGNDLRRSPAAIVPVNRVVRDAALRPARAGTDLEARRRLHHGGLRRRCGCPDPFDGVGEVPRPRDQFRWDGRHSTCVIRHPDVVDRLVLCCTSPGGVAPSYPLHELGSLESGRGLRDADASQRPAMGPGCRRADPRAGSLLRPDGGRGHGDARPRTAQRSSPPARCPCRPRRRRRPCIDHPADAGLRRPLRRHRSARELRTPGRRHPECDTEGLRRRAHLHGSGPIGVPGHHRIPRGAS